MLECEELTSNYSCSLLIALVHGCYMQYSCSVALATVHWSP